MCGISGFINLDRDQSPHALEQTISAMSQTLHHRGPDSAGLWVDAQQGIALGHQRLAIQDLSPSGHQPMHDNSQRYTLVFNGEIYNFNDLKQDLDPHPWRGHSDTEVLLAALTKWGIDQTLQRTVGMFALALWDRHTQTLILARDRMGEKPLYYGWQGRTLLFGSELKPLQKHPQWQGVMDRHALTLYLRHNAIPAPHSIYQGIFKLQPGCYCTFSLQGSQTPCDGKIHTYWSMHQQVQHALQNPFQGDAHEAEKLLADQLHSTVRQQMIADVPLGAFLSGGIDSSLIAAVMQAESSKPIHTFTIGFQEADHDESPYAQAIAQHLGTQHTTLQVTHSDALDMVSTLPTTYDEPFSDSSQLPTLLLAKLTRQHVTVALSGDGGDELFGGYDRYGECMKLWKLINHVPGSMRGIASKMGKAMPPGMWSALLRPASPWLPKKAQGNPGDIVHKVLDLFASPSQAQLYRHMVSHWDRPETLVLGSEEPHSAMLHHWQTLTAADAPIHKMMYVDSLGYLPDDILVKVDRAAMAASLETRVPLLDHRMVELAWTLPLALKRSGEQGKQPLRGLLTRYMPERLFERPKMGFGIPLEQWLRGPLKTWAADLLAPERLQQQGLLNPVPIQQAWQAHQSGQQNLHYPLWDILMLQAWLEHHQPRLA
ncbi:asparagine synthase (glutamine-hydrolyzing) [Magnetococcus sp. PR-3]|uniref:asparagine synthase (glutamine-hydrolyzing) n=1 Tax=Magnetococcus sp. PR-3 TaxID=3120355 RepID=UPI002FCE2184